MKKRNSAIQYLYLYWTPHLKTVRTDTKIGAEEEDVDDYDHEDLGTTIEASRKDLAMGAILCTVNTLIPRLIHCPMGGRGYGSRTSPVVIDVPYCYIFTYGCFDLIYVLTIERAGVSYKIEVAYEELLKCCYHFHLVRHMLSECRCPRHGRSMDSRRREGKSLAVQWDLGTIIDTSRAMPLVFDMVLDLGTLGISDYYNWDKEENRDENRKMTKIHMAIQVTKISQSATKLDANPVPANQSRPRTENPASPEGSKVLVHVSSRWGVVQGLGSPSRSFRDSPRDGHFPGEQHSE
ncbi:hypothetical protein LguiA_017833 [Lonicera macranthoides]